ncbi:MAG TPA: glycosyltransferase family 39 protein [Steroidobacteraceae bacterium]|nr:glycosyltransferase family 39 protein [Steroidobacteraceae bacterium]
MSKGAVLMRAWPVFVVAALLPIWLVGLFGRSFWTPDEPREADIAWHMMRQTDKSIPEFAGKPFAEKPPLAYWAVATSMSALGPTPGAARLPNLLYAMITVLAVAGLAKAMRDEVAAVVAGLAAGSFQLAYQVSIWLVTDAPLVACVAVALLGLHRGLIAARGRAKLAWYILMHVGMLGGFLSKGAIGWIVPGLAFLVLLAWERRWHELKCWELYAGFAIQVGAIGYWIWNVAQRSDGAELLKVLFWYNLVGRFVDVPAAAGFEYARGHHNWFGKYLLQAPAFLAPWTLLAIAAGRHAYQRIRAGGTETLPWKLIVAVIVPGTLLLSISSTARGIYVAPLLPAVGLMIGLWVSERLAAPDRIELGLLRATAWVVVGVIGVVALAVPIMIVGARDGGVFDLPRVAVGITACLGAAALVIVAIRRMAIPQPLAALARLYAAFAILVTGVGIFVFPIIDSWQDLRRIASEVRQFSGSNQLALYQPDETTIAMLDYDSSAASPVEVNADDEKPAQQAIAALLARDANVRVLVQLPGHASGPLSMALRRWHLARRLHDQPQDSSAARLARALGLNVERVIEVPEGRRYVLLERTPAVADSTDKLQF